MGPITYPETVKTLALITNELCSELDLHYGDRDVEALQPTLNVVESAARVLKDAKHPLPDALTHVLLRFSKPKQ